MLDDVADRSLSRPELLRNAPMATLRMLPASQRAKGLEEQLLAEFLEAEVTLRPRKRARRTTAVASLRRTLSAFLADLLLHSTNQDSAGYCFRSFNREAFSETVAESRQFEAVVELWTALGLIEVEKGFQGTEDFDGEPIRGRGWATRFRATGALLNLAAQHGVQPDAIGEHYIAEKGREYPIALRAKKRSRRSGAGRSMRVNRRDPEVQKLAAEIREINQFLSGFDFSFGEAPRFRRIFNNGDQPSFRWNQGGRLTAFGKDSFQQMSPESRRSILISGDPTVELDVRSSQLSIAYGLLDQPLPKGDLYAVGKLPRVVVKGLVTAMLGRGGRPTRWPETLREDYLAAYGRHVAKDYQLRECVELVAERHPILLQLHEHDLDIYRLQYVESCILIRSILRLIRSYQTPALPIHDCLIVRRRDKELVGGIMREEFRTEVGFEPFLAEK